MKNYIFIIRGGDEIDSLKSPEEMQEHMQDWQKWMRNLANQNKLIGGEPLQKEAKSIIESGKKIVDRPLAEGKELVGGYILIKADSLNEATTLATGCPGFDHNCTIEIREIMPMH